MEIKNPTCQSINFLYSTPDMSYFFSVSFRNGVQQVQKQHPCTILTSVIVYRLYLRGSNASTDDTFTSVDAKLPPVSPQTRRISQVIRDVKFRDTINLDVGVTVSATADDHQYPSEDAATADTEKSGKNLSIENRCIRSSADVGDRLGRGTAEDENQGGNGDNGDKSARGREDELATNVVSDDGDDDDDDDDDWSSHGGLAIDREVANGNDILHQQIKKGPISYQHSIETLAETETMGYPQLPPLSSQQGADAESQTGQTVNHNEELENPGLEDSQMHDPMASQNKSLLSEFSETGSMVPNPFYEQDRSRTLVDEEPETQETHENANGGDDSTALLSTPTKENIPPESTAQRHHTAVDSLEEPSPMLDDTEIDIDNIDLPSPGTLWASTAPAQPDQSAAVPALSAAKRTRRALSSPRQLSNSPAFETQERQPQDPAPVNGKRDSSSAPAFERTESEQPVRHAESIIDLTNSSPPVSPDGSSDEDYARSYGLPRGPGWVKKNIPATERRTRSSTGRRSAALSSSPSTRRLNVK